MYVCKENILVFIIWNQKLIFSHPSFTLVYIEEIKEIRSGVVSKDFANYLRKIEDPNSCIVIVYGNSFRLKTLSCMGNYFFMLTRLKLKYKICNRMTFLIIFKETIKRSLDLMSQRIIWLK